VDFGSAEGILQNNNANIVVNSSLTGTGGLTVTGTTAGSVTLNAADSYTGGTTLNGVGGTLNVGNVSPWAMGR